MRFGLLYRPLLHPNIEQVCSLNLLGIMTFEGYPKVKPTINRTSILSIGTLLKCIILRLDF